MPKKTFRKKRHNKRRRRTVSKKRGGEHNITTITTKKNIVDREYKDIENVSECCQEEIRNINNLRHEIDIAYSTLTTRSGDNSGDSINNSNDLKSPISEEAQATLINNIANKLTIESLYIKTIKTKLKKSN
jgi:hypothetical protein